MTSPPTASPVFAVAPPGAAVARPDQTRTPILGVGAVVVIGAVVFMSLSQGRAARAQATAPPPPPASPSQPAPVAAPAPVFMPGPLPEAPMSMNPYPPLNDGLAEARLRAPAMVVDLSEPPVAAGLVMAANGVAPPGAVPAAPSAMGSAEERFAERVGSAGVETARATRLHDTRLIVPQGAVIAAVLETGVKSDLPGFVRAVVSRDVRGFDGSTVLIPRGSKLVGQYRNGVAVGQTRVFVVWSRVLTPDGISIEIGSPSADSLGRGGMEGEVNSHFLRRFGASILLSVISSGLDALGGSRNGDTAIVIGSPQQATSIATLALQKEIDIPTTITVPQGAAIRVFVARDLDFSSVMSRP